MMMFDLRYMNLSDEQSRQIQSMILKALEDKTDVDITLHFRNGDLGLPVPAIDWRELKAPPMADWRLN